MNLKQSEYLEHFGVKGMKWGRRKKVDAINSVRRTIKKGTEIQNITSKKYQNNGRHMYGAYTSYDKNMYGDMMGNFMYDGKAFKNMFEVKTDIKIPSDKDLVDSFLKIAKENPKQVAKDMAAAHNAQAMLLNVSPKKYEKLINKATIGNVKAGEKITAKFIEDLVDDKLTKTRSKFFRSLVDQGFDAMSDTNDRDRSTQDPLIFFNPSKSLEFKSSVKLTAKQLEAYSEMNSNNINKTLDEIQR